jgi:DNA topoisomerase-1
LLEAPDVDPEGNPTVVKFSRKNQAQYVGSETAEGKQTKWSLVFQDGKWVEA